MFINIGCVTYTVDFALSNRTAGFPSELLVSHQIAQKIVPTAKLDNKVEIYTSKFELQSLKFKPMIHIPSNGGKPNE